MAIFSVIHNMATGYSHLASVFLKINDMDYSCFVSYLFLKPLLHRVLAYTNTRIHIQEYSTKFSIEKADSKRA